MDHIFLSYSHKDENLMYKLREGLNKEKFPVWTDENLDPGTDDWQKAIEKAIQTSSCVIVILTPNSKDSTYVRNEIAYAGLHDVKVFALLMDGDEKTSIPFELMNVLWIDARPNVYRDGFQKLLIVVMKLYLGFNNRSQNEVLGFRGSISLSSLIERSSEEIWISGVALDTIALSCADFVHRLKNDDKFKLRVLALNPSNTALVMNVNDYFGHAPGSLSARIPASLDELCKDIQTDFADRVEIKTIDFRPSCGYFIIDPERDHGFMTVVLYLYRFRSLGERPMLFFSKTTEANWFNLFLKEYRELWEIGKGYDCAVSHLLQPQNVINR